MSKASRGKLVFASSIKRPQDASTRTQLRNTRVDAEALTILDEGHAAWCSIKPGVFEDISSRWVNLPHKFTARL